MTRLSERAIDAIVDGRNPADDPRPGDIVISFYPAIGRRQVISADECGVRYWQIRPNGIRREMYCLPGIWQKWCRAHRVTSMVVDFSDGVSEDK